MHHMLTKIVVCFIEGETYNIEDLKIYWDLRTKQFRHLFFCDRCGEKVGCCCYDMLIDAITDVEYGSHCEKCATEDILNDLDVEELIYRNFDEERIQKVENFAAELVGNLSEEDLESYGMTEDEIESCGSFWEFWNKILSDTGKYGELQKYAISLMSDTERHNEYVEACQDIDCIGLACDM